MVPLLDADADQTRGRTGQSSHRGGRQVYDASRDEGSTIIDAHGDGAAGALIAHGNVSAKG